MFGKSFLILVAAAQLATTSAFAMLESEEDKNPTSIPSTPKKSKEQLDAEKIKQNAERIRRELYYSSSRRVITPWATPSTDEKKDRLSRTNRFNNGRGN